VRARALCSISLSLLSPSHQGQELGGRCLQGRPQVRVKVDDVLQVDAQLVGVLPEGVTVWREERGEREREDERAGPAGAPKHLA